MSAHPLSELTETADFGSRLRHARHEAGLSQTALAERLGVKLKTVQGWESGQRAPRSNKLQFLAGVLNVSIMWLLSGRSNTAPGPQPDGVSDVLAEVSASLAMP